MKPSNIKRSVSLTGIAVIVVIIITISVSRSTTSAAIKVGVILPLSGQYAGLGESIKNAMTLSLKNLPAGEKVDLLFEDDQFDSKTGLSAYHKLVDFDHVSTIISFVSPTVEVLKPIINKTDQIMFILGDELSHDTDHVFQLMPEGAGLFGILGQEAAKRYSSISVVYASDNGLFTADRQSFLTGLSASVSVKNFPVQSSSDMKTEAAEIVQAKNQAFTLLVPVETGIKLLKELNKYPAISRPQIICDPDIEVSIQQYVSAVGSDMFNNCIATTLADTKTTQFVSDFMSAYGSDPQFGSDYGYDAVQIIGKLSTMDQSDRLKFLNKGFRYSGVSGDIYFDSTGTRPAQAEIDIFRNGKFSRLEQ